MTLYLTLNANAIFTDDLKLLSTRFEHPDSLVRWKEFKIDGWVPKWEAPKVENGRLVPKPKFSEWFEDNYVGHLYHEVEGDFIVTTRIQVKGAQASLPQRSFSLAGFFIRAPCEFTKDTWTLKGENWLLYWLLFSIGIAWSAGKPYFRIKSTYNSLSTLKIFNAPEGWIRLRLARSSELFTMLYQEDGTRK